MIRSRRYWKPERIINGTEDEVHENGTHDLPGQHVRPPALEVYFHYFNTEENLDYIVLPDVCYYGVKETGEEERTRYPERPSGPSSYTLSSGCSLSVQVSIIY